MSTVISASTTLNTAYNVTPDTSGSLAFATGATPTTAMTISSAQVVTFANQPTYTGGTANGVAYLNGSKVLTTGSALVFDGTNLGVGRTPTSSFKIDVQGDTGIRILDSAAARELTLTPANAAGDAAFVTSSSANGLSLRASSGSGSVIFASGGTSEKMRLDSSGNLAIGLTEFPCKLNVTSGYAKTDTAERRTLSVRSTEALAAYPLEIYLGLQGNATSANQVGVIQTGHYGLDFAANLALNPNGGNVGVGTSLPTTKLSVVQTLQGNSVGTGAELLMTTSTATNDRLNLNFSMNGVGARARAAIGAVALDASGGYNCGLAFYTRSAADGSELATTDERMRLDTSGNLLFNSGYGSVAKAYGCRAWVNFNGTGTVAIRASGNVSSITDNGAGYYTVNFTTAMPDNSYAALAASSPNSGSTQNPNMVICPAENTWSTSSVNVRMYFGSSYTSEDAVMVSVAIFR